MSLASLGCFRFLAVFDERLSKLDCLRITFFAFPQKPLGKHLRSFGMIGHRREGRRNERRLLLHGLFEHGHQSRPRAIKRRLKANRRRGEDVGLPCLDLLHDAWMEVYQLGKPLLGEPLRQPGTPNVLA